MAERAWRVAVTRDDESDPSVHRAVEEAGFIAVSCPVLIEGPAPDPTRLHDAANNLEQFDWVICASARSVRAISQARGSAWPPQVRTAAVGAVTATAMRQAGAAEPIVGDAFNAKSLWHRLAPLDSWPGRRILVTTVAGGRRDVIDGLRAAGADVTEVEAYSMLPRPVADIRRDWAEGNPDAVILGSAAIARHLIAAIGVEAIRELRSIVPIGPTTAAALREAGIEAEPPEQATFAAAIAKVRRA